MDEYFRQPWGHFVQVLPLMAAAPATQWDQKSMNTDVVNHLAWSLGQWSAFRNGKGRIKDAEGRLAQHLFPFINDIQRRESRRLSEIPEDSIDDFAGWLSIRGERFGKAVKRKGGLVLPSKTAHMLLPALVPAYDNAVIVGEVLNVLLPPRTPERGSYRTYVKLCWWILRQLAQEGELDHAIEAVGAHLQQSWFFQVLGAKEPSGVALRMIDSTVAEYLLTGMAWLECPNDTTWKFLKKSPRRLLRVRGS